MDVVDPLCSGLDAGTGGQGAVARSGETEVHSAVATVIEQARLTVTHDVESLTNRKVEIDASIELAREIRSQLG